MTNHSASLKALADPSRQWIVEQLSRQPMTVRQLTDRMTISQPAVSQHLDVLRKARIVTFEPRGASNVYRIDPRGLGALRSWLDRFWDEALSSYARLFYEEGNDRAD